MTTLQDVTDMIEALRRIATEAARAHKILMNHPDLVELDKAINDSIDVLCRATGV
jgi:hypothetical protein